jgi:outer membrane protein assembly factor BamD (BamD/ComL family)
LICSLTACGTADKEVYVEKPVDELYNKTQDELTEENYAAAAKSFADATKAKSRG